MVKRIVIIGGGFAGSYIARYFDKNKNYHVTLIDNKNYFEFTPSIVKVLTNPNHIKNIQVRHEDYLKNSEIIIGNVVDINPEKNKIEVKYESKQKNIFYDHLVISSGSTYNLPFKENNLILPVRADHLTKYHNTLEKSNEILIVGGGLVGVEIAGEISQNYNNKNITIIHSKEKLMERQNQKCSLYAKKILELRGVKIIFNEKVIKNKNGVYFTDKGTDIKSDLCFVCTGIVPNFDFMKNNLKYSLNENNYVIVNEFLQVKNYINIFAAGDISDVKEEKTAQNAIKQGNIVCINIKNSGMKRPLVKYESTKRIMVISLGKYCGILTYKEMALRGLLPAFMKWAIEKREMMKF